MSLLVWLPMTKDLIQQGLSDLTVTNNGATLNDNGKLGKCYYFDGNAHYLEFSKSLSDLYSGNFSYAVWLKPTDDTRSIICSEYSASGASNVAFELSAARGIRLYWNGSPDIYPSNCTLPKNEWSHVVITRSGNVAMFYINGVLKYTYTGTLANKTSTANIRLGDDYRGGTSVSYMGYMNDFRIYDHALSPKEIEILSRGLVCHYPLNNAGNGQKNYLKNSNFLQGTNGMEGYTATGATCTKQTDCMKVVSGGASSGFYTSNFDSITTGDMTTFSAWVKADSSMTIYIGTDGSGTGNCQAYTVGNSWQRISISKEKTTNNANLRIYGQGTFYVRHMKYELGSIATSWMPNPADSAYSAMGYNSTTEYDVSGYGYNGTKNGTIAYLTDTPRYNVSTNIKSASSYIQIPNLTTTGFKHSYSIAWWGKVPSYQGYMMWGFSDGQRLNGIFNGNLWNTGDGANNPLYIPGTTTQVTVPTTKVWHHWVMTGDGTTCKVYQDGVLWGQAKTYKSISGTTIYINGWDSGTSYTYSDYQMSDFRIYATALSATQIAELYNTAVSVANNGALLGYELVEV